MINKEKEEANVVMKKVFENVLENVKLLSKLNQKQIKYIKLNFEILEKKDELENILQGKEK